MRKIENLNIVLAEKWLNLTAPDHAYCIVRLLVTILPFTNNRRVVINNTKVYLVTFSKKKKVPQSLHESYIAGHLLLLRSKFRTGATN